MASVPSSLGILVYDDSASNDASSVSSLVVNGKVFKKSIVSLR